MVDFDNVDERQGQNRLAEHLTGLWLVVCWFSSRSRALKRIEQLECTGCRSRV